MSTVAPTPTRRTPVHPWILLVVVLIPILPHLLVGGRVEMLIRGWLAELGGGLEVATAAIALLALDVFLPVPSTVVAAAAGYACGALAGGIAVWIGLSLGGAIGYLVASPLGRRLDPVRPRTTARIERWLARRGAPAVVVSRPIPVLAEAVVLLAGLHRMSGRRFWPALLGGNLLAAALFSGVGAMARGHPTGVGVGVLVLLAVVGVTRRRGPGGPTRS